MTFLPRQQSTENFGANFGANFGGIFGNFVSKLATFFGNFVQQKGEQYVLSSVCEIEVKEHRPLQTKPCSEHSGASSSEAHVASFYKNST